MQDVITEMQNTTEGRLNRTVITMVDRRNRLRYEITLSRDTTNMFSNHRDDHTGGADM